VISKRGRTLIEFAWEDGDAEWDGSDDGTGWMGRLVPLREALIGGDWRALCIAWLENVQRGTLDDGEIEPPVPAGLGARSGVLSALAQFLHIDSALIEAAAAGSAPAAKARNAAQEITAWVKGLSDKEIRRILVSLLSEDGPNAKHECLRKIRTARADSKGAPHARVGRRTVGEIRALWEGVEQGPRKRGKRKSEG